jgi:hypothetical protein
LTLTITQIDTNASHVFEEKQGRCQDVIEKSSQSTQKKQTNRIDKDKQL